MRVFLLVGVFFALVTQHAFAATLYIDPQSATLHRGDAVTLSVRLDTDEFTGECINAIDAVISYSPSVIPVDISTGNSIFSMWVERPTINRENNTITFAGGIPNGYCGRIPGDPRLTNVVAELIFRAPGMQVGGGDNRNSAEIAFTDQTIAYLNDGFGTQAELAKFGTTLTLLDTIGSEIKDDWRIQIQNDQIPPEPFSIELVRGETVEGDRHYIIFSTTDKQTGISHYEVLEEAVEDARWFSFGAVTAPWQIVSGPVYILKDQSLTSVIRVKAVDKAGNEYIASLQPTNTPNYVNGSNILVVIGLFALIALIVVLLLIIRKLFRYKKMNRKLTDEDADNNIIT